CGGLLAAVRSDVGRPHPILARSWLRLAESWVRFRRVGAPFVLAFLISLVIAAAVFVVLRPHKLTPNSSVGVAQGATAVLAALAVLWAGSLVAARFLLWDSAKGARLFESSNSSPMNDVTK